MELSNLLSTGHGHRTRSSPTGEYTSEAAPAHGAHQYSTRQASQSLQHQQETELEQHTPRPTLNKLNGQEGGRDSLYNSPSSPSPKHVAFELLLDERSKYRARIPMRVQIFPHDTTDSIVTTVKNFYGIYDGAATGVSFEDEHGITLIARYENLRNNMTVYVRVIADPSHASEPYGPSPAYSMSPVKYDGGPGLGEPFHMSHAQPAQILDYGQPPSRPASRSTKQRSTSPQSGHGRRSASLQKARSRSGLKSRASSTRGSLQELNSDDINGYSSSDGGQDSVTSSRKARSEQLASAEISLDNILQENRRKRTKFESSVRFARLLKRKQF